MKYSMVKQSIQNNSCAQDPANIYVGARKQL